MSDETAVEQAAPRQERPPARRWFWGLLNSPQPSAGGPEAGGSPDRRFGWRVRAWWARLWKGSNDHLVENVVPYLLIALFVLFILVALAPRIFISIYPGQLGVLYSRFGQGTVTSHVYGEGFHIVAPWDILTKYNVRVQQEPLDVLVLTREAMTVRVTASVRYYPEKTLIGFLHANVGPDYVEKVVTPEAISVLRAIAGTFSAEEIYSSRVPLEQAVNESLERLARKYVVLDAVIIKSIALPPKVQEMIDQKVVELQRVQMYKYTLQREQLEAQRRRIEAEGIRRANRTVSSSLTPDILRWRGIEATEKLANSPNSKVILLGNGAKELPVILGRE